jgi:patatin-like phospholipase/acyl hydrolase
MIRSHNHPIFLLSIDGGGILGLFALSVLQHLEQRMKRPIHSLFDCISGVSAGGLIALGLVVPHGNHSGPAHCAEQLIDVFQTGAQEIFHKKIHQKIPIISTLGFLMSAKYCALTAKKMYTKLLGQHTFSQSLTQTIIPAYNIHGTDLKTPRIKIFDSLSIKRKKTHDYFMHDIALATSAVPTYFPPHRIHTITNGKTVLSDDYFIDGGVAINNPTLLAYEKLRSCYPKSPIHILSLGSGRKLDVYADIKKDHCPGTLAWLSKIGVLISDPQLSVYEKVLKNLRKKDQNPGAYWRIEPHFRSDISKLDNVSDDHLKYISKASADMMHRNRHVLDAIIHALSQRHLGL